MGVCSTSGWCWLQRFLGFSPESTQAQRSLEFWSKKSPTPTSRVGVGLVSVCDERCAWFLKIDHGSVCQRSADEGKTVRLGPNCFHEPVGVVVPVTSLFHVESGDLGMAVHDSPNSALRERQAAFAGSVVCKVRGCIPSRLSRVGDVVLVGGRQENCQVARPECPGKPCFFMACPMSCGHACELRCPPSFVRVACDVCQIHGLSKFLHVL